MTGAALAPEDHGETLHAYVLLVPQLHGSLDVLRVFRPGGRPSNCVVVLQELIKRRLRIDGHKHDLHRFLQLQQLCIGLGHRLLVFLLRFEWIWTIIGLI